MAVRQIRSGENPRTATRLAKPKPVCRSAKFTVTSDGAFTINVSTDRPFSIEIGPAVKREFESCFTEFSEARIEQTAETGKQSEADPELTLLLDMIYRLDGRGNSSLAMDLVIDYIDDALNVNDLLNCEAILDEADPQQLSDELIVAMLGITSAASSRLTNRSLFFSKSRDAIAVRRGPNGADKLLAKYR